MLLSALRARFDQAGPSGADDVEVVAVTNESHRVSAGTLFCCIPGSRFDGHEFAAEAVERGAVALLVERPVPVDVAQFVVPDTRSAMAEFAAVVHGHPSETLTVVGITGTNGKTTTAQLIAAILEAAGMPTIVIGTMSGTRTTPEAGELQATMAAWRDQGGAAVVMEVSSPGLVAHRVDSIAFAAAVFTNLGTDHLDEHGDMESYFEAKALLFDGTHTTVGIVNVDDSYGHRLAERDTVAWRRYSMADAENLELELGLSRFTWNGHQVTLALGGRHNVSNALAALTTVSALGVDTAVAVAGLASVTGVRGHGELVDVGQPYSVVVDYAHTPEALEAVLGTARDGAGPGRRVIAVFGCGGDRDPSKRPLMGRAAADTADLAIVTSDNPRSEDPKRIIDAVVAGMNSGRAEVVVEPDREAAIAFALATAAAGDVVVVAGKGHETGQIIGTTEFPFDDIDVVTRLAASIAHRSPQ